eukprot:TRINITY_DN1285_c0_g1::TRINITY_DN1285_c0_g1_i1::g.26844::m.26844 TRINITY_DN1285_c0_g1::TRINITY_DN1285_c0_g1_i1::g.26844  ORF type:complete len:971 (-),score=325.28,sp/F4IJK6/KN14R_ARATH/38.97/2e-113,Kinesin/PF00225.18/7.6e-105,Kinesin/PF00225.18/8.4e+03,DUF3052/PF11253.3/0.036,DUF4136/PF13590.1/0.078,Ribosomal_S25/PF03297.10/62,Ribosomal_S25/PF03297.10/10 TRINITY_DN1285_c0_g1_i1:14-2926(-)
MNPPRGDEDDPSFQDEGDEGGSQDFDIDLSAECHDRDRIRQRFTALIDIGIESMCGFASRHAHEYIQETRKEFMKNGDQLLTNLFVEFAQRGSSTVEDRIQDLLENGTWLEAAQAGLLIKEVEDLLINTISHVVSVERVRLENEVARMREDHSEEMKEVKDKVRKELEAEGFSRRSAEDADIKADSSVEATETLDLISTIKSARDRIQHLATSSLKDAYGRVQEGQSENSTDKVRKAMDSMHVQIQALLRDSAEVAEAATKLSKKGLHMGSGGDAAQIEELRDYYENQIAEIKDSVDEMLIERENVVRKQLKAEKDEDVRKIEAALMAYREKESDLVNALHAAEQKIMHQEMLLGKTTQEMEELQGQFARLQSIRKKLFNQVQELKGNIRVFCRVRPLDTGKGERRAVLEATGDQELTVISQGTLDQNDVTRKTFEFDVVFSPTTEQDQVFAEVESLITSVMDGYNVCIFAYGQTGSGKTHTMQGGPGAMRGINLRSLERLFKLAGELKHQDIDMRLSIVEIYNETIKDLLSGKEKLEIRQGDQGVFLPGLTEEPVNSIEEIVRLMDIGSKNRSTGPTNMNVHSSRSHLIVTIWTVATNQVTGQICYGKLNLVDLAGSERLSRSEATGDRMKETLHINKSLSSLGDVISALVKKDSHIPYRNSKLTYLLQDSLGGDSKTLMFANLSPADVDAQETLSTVNFAARVRSVMLGPATRHRDTGDQVRAKQKLEEKRASTKAQTAELATLQKKTKETQSMMKEKDQLIQNYMQDAQKYERMVHEYKDKYVQIQQALDDQKLDSQFAREQALRCERDLKAAQQAIADLRDRLKDAGVDPGPDTIAPAPKVATRTPIARRPGAPPASSSSLGPILTPVSSSSVRSSISSSASVPTRSPMTSRTSTPSSMSSTPRSVGMAAARASAMSPAPAPSPSRSAMSSPASTTRTTSTTSSTTSRPLLTRSVSARPSSTTTRK